MRAALGMVVFMFIVCGVECTQEAGSNNEQTQVSPNAAAKQRQSALFEGLGLGASATSSSCKDTNAKCFWKWKKKGYCKKYPSWMKRKGCHRTCGFCKKKKLAPGCKAGCFDRPYKNSQSCCTCYTGAKYKKSAMACTSCQAGHFLQVNYPKNTDKISYLSSSTLSWYTDRKVDVGYCRDPLKDTEGKQIDVNDCVISQCLDGDRGNSCGYGGECKNRVCTRICYFGGRNTRAVDMKRRDGKRTKFGKKMSAGYGAGGKITTEPQCLFRKIVTCNKKKAKKKDKKKCGGCKDQTCRESHCGSEICNVSKEVKCYAIVAEGHTGKITDEHKAECNLIDDACGNIARMF